jgi:hypothetical protein
MLRVYGYLEVGLEIDDGGCVRVVAEERQRWPRASSKDSGSRPSRSSVCMGAQLAIGKATADWMSSSSGAGAMRCVGTARRSA